MNVDILIKSNELQKKVLEYINSEEFDKMFNSTVFADMENGRNAVIHGMCIASMLTCRCKRYWVDVDDTEKCENPKEIAQKPYKHEEEYYTCPNCDCQISKGWFNQYCEHCGQKVDWD